MSPPTSTPWTSGEAVSDVVVPVMNAAGPFARIIEALSWTLIWMAVAVLLVVVVALALALFGPKRMKDALGGEKAILIGGVAFPVVVLSAILVYGLAATSQMTQPGGPGELKIRVVGEMWWWRVDYMAGEREAFETANEVWIPAGRPVTLILTSADVIHSFWIPQLAGKMDMIPGRTNTLRIQADRPGIYRGQCAEYCGGPHALMGLVVVALPPEEFDQWLVRQAAPAAPPTDELQALGLQLFERNGCPVCHTIRGTGANGAAGPDLTHVGGRLTLGAGILPNNQGTIGGWVSDVQALKPGVRMPSYDTLQGIELRALAAYLESLK